MSDSASFDVDVSAESARLFAEVSGDFNPLHTDANHAARTPYRRQVLHGAFSAGLVSRMAGMYLPGTECLLHGMRLKFLAPIVLPAALRIDGQVESRSHESGRVSVSVTDRDSGIRYVDASYEFGVHAAADISASPVAPSIAPTSDEPVVLVTGATGGIGQALLAQLGSRGIGVARQRQEGLLWAPSLEAIREAVGVRRLSGIVHLAWPSPDNVALTVLADPHAAVEHQVAGPLRQMIALAQLLRERGTPDAMLLLAGSTAAAPGRHNYRMPLYTLGKSLVPELSRILALELGGQGQRCASVVFDVVEAGMNMRLSRSARIAHAGRAPTGLLPTADDAAAQLCWMLDNRSFLLSGATVTLSGGAVP